MDTDIAMLAAESSPAVLATAEEPSAPHPGSLRVLEEKVLVEEVVLPAVPEDRPPDGGLRAWLVVFGVTCGMFVIGIISSWGTWQAYYQEDVLRNQSSSNIAWIGSVQSAMGYAPGLFVGRLFDMGYLKLPVFASSILFVGCMFLTAECTQYWQFLLCQGFGIGIASGVIFNIGSMVLIHWFKRRLGLALAIVYGGTSVGGCIFPIITKALLQRTSFPWTTRILGFITLGFLVLTNFTVARRLPGTQDLGPVMNFADFKKPVYSVYVTSLVINNLALMTVLTYITVSAIGAGVDVNLSYDLVAIINAVSAFGQLGGGLLADRYDPLNVLVGSTLMAAVATYAWPFATNVAACVVVAVFIGISAGGVYAAMVQPFERMGRLEDVGLRLGMGFTFVTVGVVAGPPLSGAIFDATGSYKNVGYCGGSMLLVSAALMVVTKQLMPRMTLRGGAGGVGGGGEFGLEGKVTHSPAFRG